MLVTPLPILVLLDFTCNLSEAHSLTTEDDPSYGRFNFDVTLSGKSDLVVYQRILREPYTACLKHGPLRC